MTKRHVPKQKRPKYHKPKQKGLDRRARLLKQWRQEPKGRGMREDSTFDGRGLNVPSV